MWNSELKTVSDVLKELSAGSPVVLKILSQVLTAADRIPPDMTVLEIKDLGLNKRIRRFAKMQFQFCFDPLSLFVVMLQSRRRFFHILLAMVKTGS